MASACKGLRLPLGPGTLVEFVDREAGVAWLEALAERGSGFPIVIYGPEGCGKTALLLCARRVLEKAGYDVVYINPLGRQGERLMASRRVVEAAGRIVERLLGVDAVSLAEAAVELAGLLLDRLKRPRLALLLDDVFQAIGVDRVELYAKSLLNLIEHPPREYEKIVVIIASSEGVSRRRLSRHMWTLQYTLWNLPRHALELLLEQIPGGGLHADEAWRFTGGNGRVLRLLYELGWDAERTLETLIEARRLRSLLDGLSREELEALRAFAEDPVKAESLILREGRLVEKLVESNLLIEIPASRSTPPWIDAPPRVDKELGVARRLAWQTPAYRLAVLRLLQEAA